MGEQTRTRAALKQGNDKSLRKVDLLAELDAYVQERCAADQFSGVVLIAKDGIPIFERACGYADLSFMVPNQIDTKFNIASITKTFTAVAIGQLVDQGKISFNDVIALYLPDFPKKVADRVTIHHLLTHTSGYGQYWNEDYRAKRYELRSINDYLKLVINKPLAFTPGDHFSYGNEGYVVLGAIIERVSGQDYYEYLQEHIFWPSAMTATGHFELDLPIPNLAVGYTYINWDGTTHPAYRTSNLLIYAVRGSPAGPSQSTVYNLLNFAQALLGHRLLSPETTNVILSGKVDSEQPNAQYAYGFYTRNGTWGRLIGHGGRSFGADAFLHIYLDIGYTVIVLSNYDRPAAKVIAHRISDLLSRMCA